MQEKTLLLDLIKKKQKKIAPITVHTVVDRHKIAITTYVLAFMSIVLLNTERE